MKFNYNKKIGNVLFIVEGGKTEFYILKKLFGGILNYSYEEIKRSNNYEYKKYESKTQKNSRVFVINASESNIQFIGKNDDFIDQLFLRLINDYEFPVDHASIYYLFDRDGESNKSEICLEMSKIYKNALDNGIYRNGLLVLSYPSIESFVCLCFEKELEIKTGKELKRKNENLKINQQKINEKKILIATDLMIKILKEQFSIEFDIDNAGTLSLELLIKQDEKYKNCKLFSVISLFSEILIDLGIIEED